MRDLIRNNQPREAIIQKMLVDNPISDTIRSSKNEKRENTLAQSCSVPPRKYEVAQSLQVNELPDQIHSGGFNAKQQKNIEAVRVSKFLKLNQEEKKENTDQPKFVKKRLTMPDTQHIQADKESHVTALVNNQKPVLNKENVGDKSPKNLNTTLDNRQTFGKNQLLHEKSKFLTTQQNQSMGLKQQVTTQRPISKKLDEKPCSKINLNFPGQNLNHSLKTSAAARTKEVDPMQTDDRGINKSSPININDDLITDFKLDMPQKGSRQTTNQMLSKTVQPQVEQKVRVQRSPEKARNLRKNLQSQTDRRDQDEEVATSVSGLNDQSRTNNQQSADNRTFIRKLNMKRNLFQMKKASKIEKQESQPEASEIPNAGSQLSNRSSHLIDPPQKPVIQDFELKDQVGRGTFGTIFKARELKTGNECALKVINKQQFQTKQHAEHVLREKNVLLDLSKEVNYSPFIVRATQSFHDTNNLYIKMEFIRGCDLIGRIRSKEMQVRNNMQFYAAEVLCALKHLHSKRVVYRDLKPEHVMIDNSGHCKLVDFGFAKQFSKNNKTMKTYTNCGTPDYIAPEVLKGIGASFQADVWSLGVLIAEILSGQTPFFHENPQIIYEKVIHCQYKLGPGVFGQARDLLNQIFVPDPQYRVDLDQIQCHQVFKFIDWAKAEERRLEAPFIPDESQMYHNCNTNPLKNKLQTQLMQVPEVINFDAGERQRTEQLSAWQDSSKVFQKQQEMAIDAMANMNMPAARGIINPLNNSTANIKVAYQRKNASPLGNFMRKNLEDVFKDF